MLLNTYSKVTILDEDSDLLAVSQFSNSHDKVSGNPLGDRFELQIDPAHFESLSSESQDESESLCISKGESLLKTDPNMCRGLAEDEAQAESTNFSSPDHSSDNGKTPKQLRIEIDEE